MSSTPPAAPRRPHPLTAHGDERVDDWYWLRSDDRDDPEVLALLEAENAHVAAALAHTDQLQADLFAEMKARIKETDLSVPFRKGERWFYSRTEEGQQYPFLCRTAQDPGADLVAGRAGPGRGGAPRPQRAGRRQRLLRPRRLRPRPGPGPAPRTPPTTTGPSATRCASATCAPATDLDDVIPDTTYGTAWAGDTTFFYVRPDEMERPFQVWRHEVGRATADDVLVFQEDDERFFVSVGLSLTEAGSTSTAARRSRPRSCSIPAAEPTRAPLVVAAPRAGRRVRPHPRPDPGRPATAS